jgi:outer membrane protein assembly factor BamD (BamD/ComL family)
MSRNARIATTAVAIMVSAALAQPTRTRRLDYDADRRTWQELPPPPPGTAAGDLHIVQSQVKSEKYRRAITSADAWMKEFGPNDALYPDLLVAKAAALVGRREFDKAHKVLEEFFSRYEGVAATEEALRLRFVVAEAYLSGVKRRFLGIPMLSGLDRAYESLDAISTDYPESPLAEAAVKTKADHLYATGEHALAELEYGRMLREFPASRYHPQTLRRSADAALASFAGVEFDGAALTEAEERYNEYTTRYRAASENEGVGLILESIRERRAEKDYLIGAYYEKTGHPASAIFYYQEVRRNWPDSVAGGKAAVRLELLGAPEPVLSAK